MKNELMRARPWRELLFASLFGIAVLLAPGAAEAQRGAAQGASAQTGTSQASAPQSPAAASGSSDYVLGSGDVVKVTVFQQPDLSLDLRIAESGSVSYPLIGNVKLGGLTAAQAEKAIASRLAAGNFIQNPQVTINVVEYRSQQVSVLGAVNKPGRYALQVTGMRLSEILAEAGGIVTGVGADTVNLITNRNGRPETMVIDIAELFLGGDVGKDAVLQAGDSIYVHRAPAYYIYGQVQRPGMYSVERGMTVAQAVAKAGGLTPRGTQNGLKLQRRNGRGELETFEPALEEPMRANDLVFIRESFF